MATASAGRGKKRGRKNIERRKKKARIGVTREAEKGVSRPINCPSASAAPKTRRTGAIIASPVYFVNSKRREKRDLLKSRKLQWGMKRCAQKDNYDTRAAICSGIMYSVMRGLSNERRPDYHSYRFMRVSSSAPAFDSVFENEKRYKEGKREGVKLVTPRRAKCAPLNF